MPDADYFPALERRTAPCDDLHDVARALWERIVASFPNEERNDIGPFATGVE